VGVWDRAGTAGDRHRDDQRAGWPDAAPSGRLEARRSSPITVSPREFMSHRTEVERVPSSSTAGRKGESGRPLVLGRPRAWAMVSKCAQADGAEAELFALAPTSAMAGGQDPGTRQPHRPGPTQPSQSSVTLSAPLHRQARRFPVARRSTAFGGARATSHCSEARLARVATEPMGFDVFGFDHPLSSSHPAR